MHENKIRLLLDNKKPTISTRMWTTWPFFTESLGITGNFDYMEFMIEYVPYDPGDLENIARAAELHGMGTMAKVDFLNRGQVAQKAVGSGFQGILFTDHDTVEDIKESISFLKPNTPSDKGMFRYPIRRFINTQPSPTMSEHAQRINDIVIAFMIENKMAMDAIEEICSIPDIDILQFGPGDYSLSVGWNRSEHVEEIKAIERKMISTALKHGKQARCEIKKPEDAQYYIDLGVRHFSVGDEYDILNQFWKKEGAKMRAMTSGLTSN